jgi:hypothetical protein
MSVGIQQRRKTDLEDGLGTLDSNPEINPGGHIFGDSKAAWSCDARELPVWAEYPQGS